MSSRMRKTAALIVALLVALSLGLVATGSAQAADGMGSNNCPVSVNGSGNVLLTGDNLNVLAGGTITTGSLLLDNSATIVCVQEVGTLGEAADNYDGTVTYYANPGSSGTDSFVVGATDNDKYYSLTVNVGVTPVSLPNPTLTQKLVTKRVKVGKKGHKHWVTRIVKKAQVQFADSSDYPEVVMYGSFMSPNPDGTRHIKSGASSVVTTSRSSLDFVLDVVNTLNDNGDVFVTAGSINTKTGKVTLAGGPVAARMVARMMARHMTNDRVWAHFVR